MGNEHDIRDMTISQILLRLHDRGSKQIQHDSLRIFRRILKSSFLSHIWIVQTEFLF